MANVTPTGKKRIRRSKVWKYMNEECTDSGRRTAICNWQHCGKKMSISYNGGTTNLIDHLVSTHGFHRTPLKPPREDASDSDNSNNSSNSKESDTTSHPPPQQTLHRSNSSSWKESSVDSSDTEPQLILRTDKHYEYFGPINSPLLLPEPFVAYTAIRDLNSNGLFKAFTKVEYKGSDKWFVLCVAEKSQTSPKIKTEKEMKENVAFLMNSESKDIQKESLSKLKYLKGNIPAEIKREAHQILDHSLIDWIQKNDHHNIILNNHNNGKTTTTTTTSTKRPREAGLGSSQILIKKEQPSDFEENSGGEENDKKENNSKSPTLPPLLPQPTQTTPQRFTSPDRKRPKKPIDHTPNHNHSHLNSPKTSPRNSTYEITSPMITPTPPLLSSTGSGSSSNSRDHHHPSNRSTLAGSGGGVKSLNNSLNSSNHSSPQSKVYLAPLLMKKRRDTITTPEPPQPLDDPKNF